jgi:putative nucleotidyltransferase with HDIG domain
MGKPPRIPNPMNVLRAVSPSVAAMEHHAFAPAEAWPLIKVVESKDLATAAHTWRVTLYTRALCEAMGLDAELIERASVAAALHDIGKIDIRDEVLKKPGRLTDDEFAEIKRHPVEGYERLVRMGVDDPVILGLVRWHHERIDGTGYPDGIPGAELPMGPRYFAVVDTFDAMTSIRPYRREVGAEAAERALEELGAKVGAWYCPEAVEAFSTLYRTGQIDWILRYFNDEMQMSSVGETSPAGRGA